jgi:hypothetical protein
MGDPLLLNKTSANLNSRMKSETVFLRQPVCVQEFAFFGILRDEKKGLHAVFDV